MISEKRREYLKEYRQKNRLKLREKDRCFSKKYYSDHREEILQKKREKYRIEKEKKMLEMIRQLRSLA